MSDSALDPEDRISSTMRVSEFTNDCVRDGTRRQDGVIKEDIWEDIVMSGRRAEGVSCRTNHSVALPPVTQGPGCGGGGRTSGNKDREAQPSPENRGGKWLLRQPHVNRPVHPRVALETCGQLQLCLRLSSSHQEPKMAGTNFGLHMRAGR